MVDTVHGQLTAVGGPFACHLHASCPQTGTGHPEAKTQHYNIYIYIFIHDNDTIFPQMNTVHMNPPVLLPFVFTD